VKMGMRGCFGVDRKRYGGGLALLWYACVTVHIQSYSPSHIDAHVFQDHGVSRCFTGFYGHPKTALRYLSWALLLSFHALSDKPWMVLGDFNEILALKEKQGCEDKSFHQMARFRDVLANCSLMDFGFLGPEFTWSNRREDDDLVRVQLDRGLATSEWKLLFPNSSVRYLKIANSNHLCLLVDLASGTVLVRRKKKG
jgi:hypothetical protein